MLTSLLLMTCAQAAPPAAPPAPAAIVAAPVVEMAGGCGSCASGICSGAMDPCPFEKKGLFAKIRNAFRPKDKCVECIPAPAKDKSQKLLFGRFHRPVNYCGAAGGGCGTAGCGGVGCSTCGLPPIPGSVPAVTPAPAPVPTPVAPVPEKPAAPPAGEGKPSANKVNVVLPAVPAPMPAPAGKPAF